MNFKLIPMLGVVISVIGTMIAVSINAEFVAYFGLMATGLNLINYFSYDDDSEA